MLKTKERFDMEPKPGLFPNRDTQNLPLNGRLEESRPPKSAAIMSDVKITYPRNGLYGLL